MSQYIILFVSPTTRQAILNPIAASYSWEQDITIHTKHDVFITILRDGNYQNSISRCFQSAGFPADVRYLNNVIMMLLLD